MQKTPKVVMGNIIRPILFILVLLGISALAEHAQAQDMTCVDTWRLKKAIHELILLDSISKDYADKDSLLNEYRKLVTSLKSEVDAIKHVAEERRIQIDLMDALNTGYINEVVIWRDLYTREKKKRFSVNAGLSYLPLNKHAFGPSVTVGWSIYRF